MTRKQWMEVVTSRHFSTFTLVFFGLSFTGNYVAAMACICAFCICDNVCEALSASSRVVINNFYGDVK